jgi:hypothetical protein
MDAAFAQTCHSEDRHRCVMRSLDILNVVGHDGDCSRTRPSAESKV